MHAAGELSNRRRVLTVDSDSVGDCVVVLSVGFRCRPLASAPLSFRRSIRHSLTLRLRLLPTLRRSRYDGVSSVDEFAIFAHRGKSFAQWKLHEAPSADVNATRRRQAEQKQD